MSDEKKPATVKQVAKPVETAMVKVNSPAANSTPVNITPVNITPVNITPMNITPVKKTALKKTALKKSTSKKLATPKKSQLKPKAEKPAQVKVPEVQVPDVQVPEVAEKLVDGALENSAEQFATYEDVIEFGQSNFDALVSANTSFALGLQALNTEILGVVQTMLKDNSKASGKLFACKMIDQIVSVQNDLVIETFNSVLEKSCELNDLGIKVIENSTAPLAERVNVVVQTINHPRAA